PLPRKRNVLPVWVPSGIVISPRPAKVGTSSSPPRAAVVNGMVNSQCRSSPSRWNMPCGLRWISTYRSPGGPPLTPGSPLPLDRIRIPSSIPAGILTCSVLFLRVRPTPSQDTQGSVISLPVPWQVGQVCCTLKKPCCIRTVPAPSQVWQVLGWVPGLAPEPWQTSQVSQLGTRISVSKPLAACSRLISNVYFRSAPRYTCGPPRRPPPPPKISPKMSPNAS